MIIIIMLLSTFSFLLKMQNFSNPLPIIYREERKGHGSTDSIQKVGRAVAKFATHVRKWAENDYLHWATAGNTFGTHPKKFFCTLQ
jgi:hypothetical protein